jgi:hypothetical protein
MTNYLETLQALTTDKIVTIEEYYCVTLHSGVQLQGTFNSDLIKTFKDRTDLEKLDFSIEDSGYIKIYFKYNGYNVDITLT